MVPGASQSTLARVLRSRALHVLIVVSLLGWFAWSWLDLGAMLRWAQNLQGPVPALVLVPLQIAVALSFSPLPSDLVGAALCVVYGFLPGSALVWLAWMLAAWIEYGLIRRMVRDAGPGNDRRRLPRWLQKLPANHPAFLICARWFPLGPHLVNGTAAASGVPLVRFSWTAAVGIAPIAILVGLITTGILSASPATGPTPGAAVETANPQGAASEGRPKAK